MQADINSNGELCEQSNGGEEKVGTRVSQGKVTTRGTILRFSSQNKVGCGVRRFCHLLFPLQVSWVLDLILTTR